MNLFTKQKRNELLKDKDKDIDLEATAIVEGNKTIKKSKQLRQIIDTTLLKCYLQVCVCVN